MAIYIRWSTEDQGEGTTLDVQLDACKSYVISQGWSFSDDLVFVDDGISGATMERPALGRMRSLIKDGRIDCVVVYKLDRLSRSVLDMVKLVLEEWKDRCYVKSAREPIDTLSPTGRMFFYQLMSFAEWERAVIKDRMHAGRVRRAQEGRDPGVPVPYGYVKSPNGTIQVDPVKGPIVKRIFKLYLSGLGARTIGRELRKEGILSPEGVNWRESSVAHILSNISYTGVLWFGKNVRKNGKRVKAAEPQVVKEGFYPALVSKADFDAVQTLKTQRPNVGSGGGRANTSPHLLTGLSRCKCGESLIATACSKGEYRYRYYFCCGAQHIGPDVCGAGMIRQDDLDKLVTSELLSRYKGAKERIVGVMVRENVERHERALGALKAAEAELDRLNENERRLKGMMIDGKMTLEEYRGLVAELNHKLTTARRTAERARKVEEEARLALSADAANTVLLDRIDEWDTLDPIERKQLLRQFVDQITAYRDKKSGEFACEITWKWAGDAEGATEISRVMQRQNRVTEKMRAAYDRRKRGASGKFVATQ